MDVELTKPVSCKSIEPLRKSQTPSPRLTDIDSQLNVNTYRDSDLVTWGHETCHGIASRIRKIEGVRTNGFYLFDNQYIWVREVENMKLADVAEMIPQSLRKRLYQLYLVDQRQYWNNEPSYVIDEAYAYQNGTVVGLQMSLMGEYRTKAKYQPDMRYPSPVDYQGYNRTRDSFVRAQEMATYAVYLARGAKQPDITAAVNLCCQRTADIARVLNEGTVTGEYADFRAAWDKLG